MEDPFFWHSKEERRAAAAFLGERSTQAQSMFDSSCRTVCRQFLFFSWRVLTIAIFIAPSQIPFQPMKFVLISCGLHYECKFLVSDVMASRIHCDLSGTCTCHGRTSSHQKGDWHRDVASRVGLADVHRWSWLLPFPLPKLIPQKATWLWTSSDWFHLFSTMDTLIWVALVPTKSAPGHLGGLSAES